MSLIVEDRVRDTSISTGAGPTGFVVDATPPTSYRTFSTVLSNGDLFPYCIVHESADEWEVGFATYASANTFTRTTVVSSSNAGSHVAFSAGTKDVFMVWPGIPSASAVLSKLKMWDATAGILKLADLASIATEAAPATGDFALVQRAEDNIAKVDWAVVRSANTRRRYYFAADDGATWTKPTHPGFVGVTVYAYGPGGGGGGSSANNDNQGGGGGGGATSIEWIVAASLGSTEAIAVGTGGTAGTSTGAGNAGNKATAFGSHLSAGPGLGGPVGGSDSGVDGGAATGGTVNLTGGGGGEASTNGGKVASTPSSRGFGGACGNGHLTAYYTLDEWDVAKVAQWGGGGVQLPPGPFDGQRVGAAGNFPGGGASGGWRLTGSQAGAAGANGLLIVEEHYDV